MDRRTFVSRAMFFAAMSQLPFVRGIARDQQQHEQRSGSYGLSLMEDPGMERVNIDRWIPMNEDSTIKLRKPNTYTVTVRCKLDK